MERGPRWEFAPFRLDPSGWMLWRENQPVALPPRAFSVLCHLVEHAGALVTKDQLLDAVWQHRFVSESVLKVCINELRRTLDDSAKAPRYIETVARRGYRFIAAPKRVEKVAAVPEQSLPLTAPIAGLIRAAEPTHYLLQRTEPLAQLQRLFKRAQCGERQVVFITGEAGIGKTTVVGVSSILWQIVGSGCYWDAASSTMARARRSCRSWKLWTAVAELQGVRD